MDTQKITLSPKDYWSVCIHSKCIYKADGGSFIPMINEVEIWMKEGEPTIGLDAVLEKLGLEK